MTVVGCGGIPVGGWCSFFECTVGWHQIIYATMAAITALAAAELELQPAPVAGFLASEYTKCNLP